MTKVQNSPSNDRQAKPRVIKGVVVSDKMQKTAVVEVSRMKKHPKYKKYFKISKRFKAQNNDNIYKIGDNVLIRESKPISKDKRWVIIGKAD